MDNWCELCDLPLRSCSHSPRDLKPASWSKYLQWNQTIADLFYGPDSAGRPAFLDLEVDMLKQAAQSMGLSDSELSNPKKALAQAVRATLDQPGTTGGVFATHLRHIKYWRANSGEVPPPVALLSVLSLAAEEMGTDGFSPHNYYDHLMSLLDFTADEKSGVVGAYQKCSRSLWECLNGWLEDLQGERGLPTAYSYTHAHIGRPLSQALIRETDREKMGAFFAEMGLAPRSRMTPSDMGPLLAEWLNRSGAVVSNSLRTMWKKEGGRDRITEVVCQILETWDPTIESATSDQSTTRRHKVNLLVLLRTFPTAQLELNVTGPGQTDEFGALDLILDESGASVTLPVQQLPGGSWRLANPQELDPASLLEGSFQLRLASGQLMERRGRRIVPLRRDPLLGAYVEVERMSLSEDALVFCQQGVAPLVSACLKLIARPGFKEINRALCPPGWVLFSGVQILSSIPELDPCNGNPWPDELNCLQPLSTEQLVVGAGFRLPGRIRQWSTLAPPELRASSENASEIKIRIENTRAFDGRDLIEVIHSFDSAVAILPISDLDLPSGDYEVTASSSQDNGKVTSFDLARVRLRSADECTSIPNRKSLWRNLDSTSGAIIGATSQEVPHQSWIQGARVGGESRDQDGVILQSFGLMPPWLKRRKGIQPNTTDAGTTTPTRLFVPPAPPGSCFRTGAHHIMLPDFRGRTSKPIITGYCKLCGLTKRYPARYSKSAVTAPKKTQRAQSSILTLLDMTKIQPTSDETAFPPNLAFDSLCYATAGNLAAFEQVALQVEPSHLFVDRFMRNLESLGHLEVVRDPRSWTAQEWEVTAPTLAQLSDGTFALTGWRSVGMLKSFETIALRNGLEISRAAQVGAPDLIKLHATALEAQTISIQLTQAIDREVFLQKEASHFISGLLPCLSDVMSTLTKQPMPGYRTAKRWSGDQARWISARDAYIPGTYQLTGATMLYCIRDEDDISTGTMRRADARVVKHAAGISLREPLVGYDSVREMMFAPLGADLPSLYERAAVLATGKLPSYTQDSVCYAGVPLDLASRLRTLLVN